MFVVELSSVMYVRIGVGECGGGAGDTTADSDGESGICF